MEYYSATIKKEILPFMTTWMDLEDFMFSEISQTEKDKYHAISLICGEKKPAHRIVDGCHKEVGFGAGKYG